MEAGCAAEGIAALAQAFGRDREPGRRAIALLKGVVFIIAGLVIAIFPGASLVLLARIAGVGMIIVGVVQLVSAISARRAPADRRSSA